MATGQYQYTELGILDIPVINSSGADIAEGVGVLFDTTNVLAVGTPPGIVAPTASGGVAATFGATVGAIANGKTGSVRVLGIKQMTAHGAVTAGDQVQISDTSSHLGQVKTLAGSGTQILGRALNTAADAGTVMVFICPSGENV